MLPPAARRHGDLRGRHAARSLASAFDSAR